MANNHEIYFRTSPGMGAQYDIRARGFVQETDMAGFERVENFSNGKNYVQAPASGPQTLASLMTQVYRVSDACIRMAEVRNPELSGSSFIWVVEPTLGLSIVQPSEVTPGTLLSALVASGQGELVASLYALNR